MKPLFNNSSNFAFNSFNSTGAILYGGMDIGSVPGISLIKKSIALSRGKPEISSGKTSGNSLTMGMSFSRVTPRPGRVYSTTTVGAYKSSKCHIVVFWRLK